MSLSRRSLFALGATVVIGSCRRNDGATPTTTPQPASTAEPVESMPTIRAGPTTLPSGPPTTAPLVLDSDPFLLGVASGDPSDAGAVLWTRLLAADDSAPLPNVVDVMWELADDVAFESIVATGSATATSDDAHSVHVDVSVEAPSWYRFRAGGQISPVGRVAPTGGSPALRIAAAACQHLETGHYAAHRDIAEWQPDLVVFLGDFIYERAGRRVGPGRVRRHVGPTAVDLAGYRARYAQYLADPQLQLSRAACPWLVIWDDHEVGNDYAGITPQSIENADGFAVRRAEAYRAWWEHMPVRLPRPPPPPESGAEPVPYPINRTIRWGDLVEVAMLDGRQFRSVQACGSPVLDPSPACSEALVPERTMLGREQEQWSFDVLGRADATWTVIAQQTVMTDLRLPNGAVLNYDQWDGYAPARERLLTAAAVPDRVVVLTGDIHLAGVGVLPGVGVEFVTTSISSDSNVPVELEATLAAFENVVDAELAHRGYTRHTVDAESWTAEYRTVDDVARPESPVSTWKTFRVDAATRDAVQTL